MPTIPKRIRPGDPITARWAQRIERELARLGDTEYGPGFVVDDPGPDGGAISVNLAGSSMPFEVVYGYLPSGTFPAATGTLPARTAGTATVTILRHTSNGINLEAAGRTEVAYSLWRQSPTAGANIILMFHRINGKLFLQGYDCS